MCDHECWTCFEAKSDCIMLGTDKHTGVDLELGTSGPRGGGPLTEMTGGMCSAKQDTHYISCHACSPQVKNLKEPCAWQRLDLIQAEEAACGHQIFSYSSGNLHTASRQANALSCWSLACDKVIACLVTQELISK